MNTLSVIFIVVLIAAELDFFALLYSKEIADWLNARAELICAKAEAIRTELRMSTATDTPNAQTYNEGYSKGFIDGKVEGMKAFMQEHSRDDEEVLAKEGTE